MNWPSVDWTVMLPVIYVWAGGLAFFLLMVAWIYRHSDDEGVEPVEPLVEPDWVWPVYGPYADIRSDGHLADLLINGGDGVSVEDYVA